MKRFLTSICLSILAVPLAAAVTDSLAFNRIRTHSFMLGVGSANVLETYLSPLEYTGTEVRFLSETQRMTKMARGRISVQHRVDGNVAYVASPTDDGKEWAGYLSWTAAWHYNWNPVRGLRLLAGAGSELGGGFVYNTRNGNNPAQGKLAVHLKASGAAIYDFECWKRPFSVRYQVDLPLVGAMFSPAYGQSYYELFSLGHYDHNVCATYIGNAPCMTHLLTLDIPVGGGTLRTGYLCDIRQSRVNGLKSHVWSNLFMIGYVKRFYLLKNIR